MRSGGELAPSCRCPRLLASVADLDETAVACALGADIIDLKDPARGALGAWPLERLREAVRLVAGRRLVSATVGDLPMVPDLVLAAAKRTAATGVDIVKVGMFADGDRVACIAALGGAARDGVRLVAVLMADQGLDLSLLVLLADAGFHGAMLDTADKRAESLRHRLDSAQLRTFVDRARSLGLLTGLAGSLRLADIAPLAALRPDYLGFRGALCRSGRETALDPAALATIRDALRAAAVPRAA
jgi:uncharacterized protein (UPF0264 family)